MKPRRQQRDVQVKQSPLEFIKNSTTQGETHTSFFAKVIQIYSDRMTCDIKTLDGAFIPNVPILTKGGLVDGEVYGEIDLPAVHDYVIVDFSSYGQRHKMVIGTIFPYLVNEFIKDAVNSSSKLFTKKLFVADKPLGYKRVFKTGTSVEIEEDGGIIIETPSGTYMRIDEANGEVKIEDQHGNIYKMASAGVTINDTNGNNITMGASSVTINGNLEVLI